MEIHHGGEMGGTASGTTAQHSTALGVGTGTEMPACDKSFGEQQHEAQLWFAKHSLMCEACERLICAEPLSAVCD